MNMVGIEESAEFYFVQAAVRNSTNGNETAYALVPVPMAEAVTLKLSVDQMKGYGVGVEVVHAGPVRSEFVSPRLPAYAFKDRRLAELSETVGRILEPRGKVYALGEKDKWQPGSFLKKGDVPAAAIAPREHVMARAKV